MAFQSDSPDCIDEDDQLTVHYKMGNEFIFRVPKTLTVRNIVFDALDSTLNTSYS